MSICTDISDRKQQLLDNIYFHIIHSYLKSIIFDNLPFDRISWCNFVICYLLLDKVFMPGVTKPTFSGELDKCYKDFHNYMLQLIQYYKLISLLHNENEIIITNTKIVTVNRAILSNTLARRK